MHAQMLIMRDIIYGATARGANFKKVCEELGLDPNELNDSDRLIPFKPAAEIWDVVINHTKDQLLGLHLGEELSPSILGMLGYLMQSSQNLYESFLMVCKYNALHSTMMKYSMEESSDKILIHYKPAPLWLHQYPESARQSVEIAMSGVLKLFKTLSGKKAFPIRVELAFPARSVSEYERVFQSSIYFNCEKNSLTFQKNDLLLPVLSYDKSLFAFFSNSLNQKLNSLSTDELLSNRVKLLIVDDFKGRLPSIETAAAHLNMTVRTLQRKLREEGASYRDIVDGLRKGLARSILSQDGFRIGEVAEILGYSDSSSFRKAYKRWSNNAPSI